MYCGDCGGEIPAGSVKCPICGHKDNRPQIATKDRVNLNAFSGLKEVTEIASGLKEQADESGSAWHGLIPEKPQAASTRPDQTVWTPNKQNVESWAITRKLNHYEVLELESSEEDSKVQERIQILDNRLEEWASDALDTISQRIGTSGKNRLFELKEALSNRHAYNKQVTEEMHLRALRELREEAARYVEKDKVLQWSEWLALERSASEANVTGDELEEILTWHRERGVLTGLTVTGGREVRTLIELKNRCRGKGQPVVEVIWNGEMERWLDQAAGKTELAADVRELKERYAASKVSGACLFLWMIGEKKLVLEGSSGVEELESVRQWKDAVEKRGAEAASLEALKDGRLENWFKIAMNQEYLSEVAAKQRDQGRRGLLEVIKHVEVSRGKPFKFKEAEAYSIGELIELCDKYTEEAEQYLLRGYFENWLANEQGEGALALQGHNFRTKYEGQIRHGLEFFVRELCKTARSNPYPLLVAHPHSIDLGQMPVGKNANISLNLINEGRGLAWGTVSLEPALPGLSITQTFENINDPIQINLDTLRLAPGRYSGEIVIATEEVPEPCRVPITYEVIPLQLRFEPATIDLGSILQGKKTDTLLHVRCFPEDGRLVGKIRVQPKCEGIKISGKLNGSMNNLRVDVDTSHLEPGRRYSHHIHLDTNVGEYRIPITFNAGMRWDIVAGWTAGLGLATGLVMAISRYILANADFGLIPWLVSYQRASKPMLVATGVFALVIILPLALLIYLYLEKYKT